MRWSSQCCFISIDALFNVGGLAGGTILGLGVVFVYFFVFILLGERIEFIRVLFILVV